MTSDIQHVAGKENIVADPLSRPAAALTPASQAGALDWPLLGAEQRDGPEVGRLQENSSLQLKKISMDGTDVWCDVSTGMWRPQLTTGLRRPAFLQLHQLAHAGVKATTRM